MQEPALYGWRVGPRLLTLCPTYDYTLMLYDVPPSSRTWLVGSITSTSLRDGSCGDRLCSSAAAGPSA